MLSRKVYLIECLGSEARQGGAFTRQNSLEPYPAECIAAVAEEWAGWEAEVLQVGSMTNEEIVAEVLNYNPSVVGLTVFSYSQPRAEEICKMIKAVRPEIITVTGGYHPSMVPASARESIDFAVIGEGEVTFTELLKNLETGERSWEEIAGLAFEKNGQLVITEPRERIQDLDSLPWAKRYAKYLKAAKCHGLNYPCSKDQVAVAEVSCSRGCSGNCSFCISGRMWRHEVVLRSVKSIVAEIKFLHETFGVNFVYVTCLTFNHSIKRVVEISKALNEAGLHNPATENDPDHLRTSVHWTCQTKVGITPEVAEIMAAGGCSRTTMGVECLSEKQAKAYSKPWKGIEEVRDSFAALDAVGIINRPNMMMGVVGESKETALEAIEGLKRMPCDQFRMSFATPLPGSRWAEELPAEMMDQDLSRYDTEHPVLKNIGISWSELEELRRMIGRDYYNSREYAEHCQAKLARFPHLLKSYKYWFNYLYERGLADLRSMVS